MRVDSNCRQFFYNQLSSLLSDKDQIQRVAFHSLRLVAAAAIAVNTYQVVMSSPRGRCDIILFVGLIQALKLACLSEPTIAVQAVRWSQALLSGVAIGAASASLMMGAQHLEAAKLDRKISTVCKAIFDIAWALGDPGTSSWHLFSKSLASDEELLQDLKVPGTPFNKIPEKVLSSLPHFFSRVLVQSLEGAKQEEPASLLSRIDRVVDFSLFAFLSGAQLYFSPKPVLGGLLIETLSLLNQENSNQSEEADQTIESGLKFFSGSFAECMRSIATKSRPLAFADALGFFGGISAGRGMASDLAEYWKRGCF